MTLVGSVLGVWLSLWACICSCLGLAEEVNDHPSELANVSSAGPNPSKYTTTNLRVTQGSFPWRSAVTADHSYAAEESTISSVWNARRPSYGHCRGDTRRSTSDSASRWLPELSVSSHGSTAPSIPFSLAIRDSSPPSTAHRSGAEDGLDYSQLGALAQRRGFKGSPIIIEPKDWKSSTASNDSYSEPGSLLTSKSLKAKFGNLLRPLPSPLPTTPLSSLFLPISDSIQNSHWDSDPFSMHGESYFAPNTSIDSPNESRLAISSGQANSAGQTSCTVEAA
ncbi:hypothetical protein GLOTRDRAFT_94043 [Gloeophyllum trabeum ATCC 11539]|uniref:Uncharacterized protein n=1 Tax=Gloeophyllum trabeum (strain ATCC 11539 / FP-39264 / Madison 617) TaxID=670483 RepID=S7Q3M1_GLOTA|nr:uncharacterized protein GLOTRDRAFT_94043 [Gloeophyllum trabeum ATCC 11539]EPQ54581.1 hypothetical protein GLOTRDRAFT_94043 [Gloeophyllum trabeum ATCC 11539]